MTQRPYDVILYGASGFVGKQTAAYFAKHPDFPAASMGGLRSFAEGDRRS